MELCPNCDRPYKVIKQAYLDGRIETEEYYCPHCDEWLRPAEDFHPPQAGMTCFIDEEPTTVTIAEIDYLRAWQQRREQDDG